MFHVWVSADEDMKSCLTCGGLWYESGTALDGEPAHHCSGNTNECHHYPGECSQEECWRTGQCNCLSCHS
jgi:hypothetical protein